MASVLGSSIFQVMNGPILAAFIRDLNGGDFIYGVTLSMTVMSGALQLGASWVLERCGRRRFLYVLTGVIQRSSWFLVALVAFLFPDHNPTVLLVLIIVVMTTFHACGSFGHVTLFSWLSDLFPVDRRPQIFAIRGWILGIIGPLIALTLGHLVDRYKSIRTYGIVLGASSILALIDVLLFLRVRDIPVQVVPDYAFLSGLRFAVRNRDFSRLLVFWGAWWFSWQFSRPYVNMYGLRILDLSVAQITLLTTVAGSVIAASSLFVWSRLFRQVGSVLIIRIVGWSSVALQVLWLFSSPTNWWPFLIASLSNGVTVTAMKFTGDQLLMTATPKENRSIYIALFAFVAAVSGQLIGYLSGGFAIEYLLRWLISAAKIAVDPYRLAFLISGGMQALTLVALLPGVTAISECSRREYVTQSEEAHG